MGRGEVKSWPAVVFKEKPRSPLALPAPRPFVHPSRICGFLSPGHGQKCPALFFILVQCNKHSSSPFSVPDFVLEDPW